MFLVDDSTRNGKYYNGNTRKFGITVSGLDYIVKYPKDDGMSVFSEYICSEFIRGLGISCHKVTLGYYNNIIVDVIEDFTSSTGYSLHSYKDTRQSSEDTDLNGKDYTYDDVLYLMDKHMKMSDSAKLEAKRSFWNMFICDAIIGNRDRHYGNWGYLDTGKSYRFAPLYDNGGGLFPDVNKVIHQYMDNNLRKKFLYDRVFVFPASLFKIRRPDRSYRTNYYKMFSDLRINKLFAEQVKKIRENFTPKDIFNLISSVVLPIDILNNSYKYFYIEIITLRFMCIILRKDFDRSFNEVERWLGL